MTNSRYVCYNSRIGLKMKKTESSSFPNTSILKGDLAPRQERPELVEPSDLGGIALIGSLAPVEHRAVTLEYEVEKKPHAIGDAFVNRDSGARFVLVKIVKNKQGSELVILETPDGSARVTLKLDSFFSGLSVEGGAWSEAGDQMAVV